MKGSDIPFKLNRIFLFYIFSLTVVFAQSRVDGRVTDKESGEPLVGVNIFFSKTTWGATTDNQGFYSLRNIPYGKYEMIISMIGYEVIKQDVFVFDNERISMNFILVPEPIQMKEVVVTAKSNKLWKKNLAIFNRVFLGESKNGQACKILNEYVLSFDVNGGALQAKASQPLEIENSSLGYRIQYFLSEFTVDNFLVRYAGDSFFVEMDPKSNRQKRKWEKNRKVAYKGSLRHFLTTLGDRFYERFNVENNEAIQKWNWSMIAGRKGDPLIKEGFDIFINPTTIGRSFDRTLFRPMTMDTLVFLGNHPENLFLSFKGKMMIRYRYESEELNYTMNNRFRTQPHEQTSFIELKKGSVLFDRKGRYFDPYMIEQQGYTAWERVGDQLPFDYDPK